MIKKIIQILSLIFIICIFNKDVTGSLAGQDNNIKVKKISTIPEITNNKSILKFTKDSLLTYPYRIPPKIVTKLVPLKFDIIGLTTEISKGVYLIQLNPNYSTKILQRTMFHELVHVLQFEKGYLISKDRTVYWKGVKSSWMLPWNLRPWEIHAEKLTEKLFQFDQ